MSRLTGEEALSGAIRAQKSGAFVVVHRKSDNCILEGVKVRYVDPDSGVVAFDCSSIGMGEQSVSVDDMHYLTVL